MDALFYALLYLVMLDFDITSSGDAVVIFLSCYKSCEDVLHLWLFTAVSCIYVDYYRTALLVSSLSEIAAHSLIALPLPPFSHQCVEASF